MMHEANIERLSRGFTLIETLVAITLLTVAIVAPMSLVTRSLSTAYYARDQFTAFHLAQEAIETVRNVRDNNILQNAFGVSSDLLAGIPSVDGAPFTVDTRDDSMVSCPSGVCAPLESDGSLYGYGPEPDWAPTRFTRSVTAETVGGNPNEVRISVTVSWQTGSFQIRTFTISENLFRWIDENTGLGSVEEYIPSDLITFFQHIDYGGAAYSTSDDIPDFSAISFGSGTMDNAVSSIQINGGTWELCEDPNYGGGGPVISGPHSLSSLNTYLPGTPQYLLLQDMITNGGVSYNSADRIYNNAATRARACVAMMEDSNAGVDSYTTGGWFLPEGNYVYKWEDPQWNRYGASGNNSFVPSITCTYVSGGSGCYEFDTDQSNFITLGINDVISSARLVASGFAYTEDSLMDLGVTLSAQGDSSGVKDGGNLTINGEALGSFDYVVIDGDVTISSGWTVGDYFSATADSKAAVVVVNGNLTVNSGAIFTPGVRKLFTFIYATGDLSVSGEISMTARGANHSSVSAAVIRIANGTYSGVSNPQVPAAGSSGGAAASSNANGNPGSNGNSGGTGGGGSGGADNGSTSGTGAAGTSFSGGAGGGGSDGNGSVGESAASNGGKGGDGDGPQAGGGAGNPGGSGSPGGVDGTGGTLVIMCSDFGGSGTVSADGSDGGGIADGGGGGSGGGSITVLCTTDSSAITPTANGGAGGPTSGDQAGGAGGNGTARKLAI